MRPTMTRRAAIAMGVAALATSARTQALRTTAFAGGSLEVFSDGALLLGDARRLAPDAPAGEVATLFAEWGLDTADVRPPLNVTLLRSGGRLALVDAGSGQGFQGGAGRLPAALAAAGIDPAAITDILLTHAHPDHLWGVLDDFDEVAFPQATVHVPRGEWEFWRSDAAMAGAAEAMLPFVVGARSRFAAIADHVALIDDGAEPLGGVEAVATPGHTPGHVAYMIHAAGVMVVGDALSHPALSFARPGWRFGTDMDWQVAAATRRRLLGRLADEQAALIGYHLPEPGLGRVERRDDAFRFVAG